MERRIYPRVATRLPAIVMSEEGVQVRALVSDISGDGLCMECNTIERDLVTPHGRFVRDDGKPVELFVELDLPNENGSKTQIQARCHVSFSRRVASNRCMLGLRYIDLEQGAYQRLLHFIDSMLQHNAFSQCAS